MHHRLLHVAIACVVMVVMACSSAFVEPLVVDVDLLATDPIMVDPPVAADAPLPSVGIGDRRFRIRNSWTEPTEDEILQIVQDSIKHGTVYRSVVCYSRSNGFALQGYKMSSGYLLQVDLFRNISQTTDSLVLELVGSNAARPLPDPEADWVVRVLTPPAQVTPDGFSMGNCDPDLLESLGRNQDGTLVSES